MQTVNIKSVILYNKRSISVKTLEAIANAKDGDLIPVDPQEMNSFLQLTLFSADVRKIVKKMSETQKVEPAEGDVAGGK